MRLSDMRTAVRDDALDRDASQWDDATVNRQINRAAKWAARFLARHQLVNTLFGSTTFTTSANTTDYALVSTDITRVRRMWEYDKGGSLGTRGMVAPAKQIPDTTAKDWAGLPWDGLTWYYYVTRDKSSKLWSIVFPGDPGGDHAFALEYVATEVPDMTLDADEPVTIPPEYHELIVARAVVRLLGPDGSGVADAAANLAGLMRDAVQDAVKGASPRMVRREMFLDPVDTPSE